MQPELLVQSFLMGSKQSQSGQRRLQLLHKIDSLGSLNAAAKACGLSYKGAWQALEAMNQLAGYELVVSQKGGAGGGGMTLTEQGRGLLNAYLMFSEKMQHWLRELQQMAPDMMDQLQLMKKMSMRTSARNLFYGTVTEIQQGAINCDVTLRVAEGLQINAQITLDSLQRLDIAVGSDIYALVKASWVILTSQQGVSSSAGNQFCGQIAQLEAGAVNSDVTIDLAAGQQITAIVSNQSVQQMQLQPGKQCCALVNASHILLAIAD